VEGSQQDRLKQQAEELERLQKVRADLGDEMADHVVRMDRAPDEKTTEYLREMNAISERIDEANQLVEDAKAKLAALAGSRDDDDLA
jgi:seryl-tRNA synthetase